ncbi:GPR1 protein, partial [Amia calva]|nr:GPR1 protein [Amia calva]
MTEKSQDVLKYLDLLISSSTILIGSVANGIVIWLLGLKCKKSEFNVWFLHLAVADFSFILCLPFRIVSVAIKYLPLASHFAYVNSCINPILHVLLRKDFKAKVWRLRGSLHRKLSLKPAVPQKQNDSAINLSLTHSRPHYRTEGEETDDKKSLDPAVIMETFEGGEKSNLSGSHAK